MIPERIIDEVRAATDIVDLISGYVTLKQRGRNHFGLCPFHAEKTPSFSVNPEKQIFHCFGCGAGGNAFTFLMRHEGVGFTEAVKFLAQRAGIRIEYDSDDAQSEASARENEALFYVNEFAADFFRRQLHSPAGEKARQYLHARGFGEVEIETYGLGYAPPGWTHLVAAAREASIREEHLEKAGLAGRKEAGGYYDRFRDRLMFSIHNLSGRVVAFAGRKLNEAEDSPKYINSPETPIYHKGRLLYGLYQNRDAIRREDRAIFVEGYTDLMTLVQAGIGQVVATSGTALTEDQARLIRRYTRRVVLMYDSDTAGSAATLRGADILLEHNLDVAVAALPRGHDPDTFLREKGSEAVHALIEADISLFDFKLNQALASPSTEQSEAIRSIVTSLAKVPDSIRRSLLLRQVAERLNMPEQALWDEVRRLLRQSRRRQPAPSKLAQQLSDLGKVSQKRKLEIAVEDLVKILVHRWDVADFIFSRLNLDDLEGTRLLPVLRYLKNRFRSGKAPREDDLIHYFNEIDLSDFIVGTLNEAWSEVDMVRWAEDCLVAIEAERIAAELHAVREEIRAAQKEGRSTRDLLKRCMDLEARKAMLQHGEMT